MFGMRFDIDSNYGLTKKLDPLLKLLNKHKVKATFFCVMGRDASICEIIKLRYLAKKNNTEKPAKNSIKASLVPNIPKIAYTLTYPRAVGNAHSSILKKIVDFGHEVYPHGWSHIQWQRNLENINIREHLDYCSESYYKIFGFKPSGFASPGRVYNDLALDLFDEYGFLFVGDMDGNKPFKPESHKCLQIPVTLFKTISEFKAEGLECNAIVDKYYRHIAEKDFSVIYEHPDNINRFELGVLDRLFHKLTVDGISSLAFSEIYKSAII